MPCGSQTPDGPETLADLRRRSDANGGIGRRYRQRSKTADHLGAMKAIQAISGQSFDGARHELIVVDNGNSTPCVTGACERGSGMPETKGVAEQMGRLVVKASTHLG